MNLRVMRWIVMMRVTRWTTDEVEGDEMDHDDEVDDMPDRP